MLIDPKLTGTERRAEAAAELITATVAMAASGIPLMLRVVPDSNYRVWDHYPPDDAVDAKTGARWFYHAHPPEERDAGEHGHFHLFLDRDTFDGLQPRAKPLDPKRPTPAWCTSPRCRSTSTGCRPSFSPSTDG